MKIEDLSRDEIFDAIALGVKQAIMELIPDRFLPDALFRAIAEGTREAVWSVATNATHMPSADFYDSIKDGVKEAHKEMSCNVSEDH